MKKILLIMGLIVSVSLGFYLYYFNATDSTEQIPEFDVLVVRVEREFKAPDWQIDSLLPEENLGSSPGASSGETENKEVYSIKTPFKSIELNESENTQNESPPSVPKSDVKNPTDEAEEELIEPDFLDFAKSVTVSIFTDKQQGSGTLLNEQGFIVTNAHVLEGHSYITIVDSAGNKYDADFVYASTTLDVGVIFVKEFVGRKGMDFSTIPASVGEKIITVGSPNGVPNTITYGRIVQTGISLTNNYIYQELYEIDAALGLGSSGGPLLSIRNKKIIAINSMIAVDVNQVGFSIPAYIFLPEVLSWLDPYKEEQENLELEALRLENMSLYKEEFIWEILAAPETKEFDGLSTLVDVNSQFHQDLVGILEYEDKFHTIENTQSEPRRIDENMYQMIISFQGATNDNLEENNTRTYLVSITFTFNGSDMVFPVTGEIQIINE